MRKFDLVIRGGTIVDGSGGEPVEGDVAVADGRIAEIGRCAASAVEEIDARGMIVTPGFIDIHTHYDAQVSWDSRLRPSSYHGVTTAVMGNCGMGFAPVHSEDHTRLIELMESVEDIPDAVLQEGLDWSWNSFPDYLNFIGSRRYDMDIAAQLPHAPLRLFVMGERACRLEPATDDDIERMCSLASEAVKAGAIGFTTDRSILHKTAAGSPTPSFKASEAELLAITKAVVEAGGGVLELSGNYHQDERGREEFALLRRIVAETKLPTTFSIHQYSQHPGSWRELLRLVEAAQAEGIPLWAQVAPRPIGAIITVEASVNPFRLSPTYQAILAQGTLAETLQHLRHPAVRSKVLSEVAPQGGGDLVAKFGGFQRLFVQRGAIDYEPAPETSVESRALANGCPPIELLYDLLHEGDRGNFVYFPVLNYTDFNLAPTREMISHPFTLMGAGDGGAHVGFISDASFPTYLLARWSAGRHRDGFDLAWVVKRQTADLAKHIGLTDRGQIAPGRKADLNVIDIDRLSLPAPEALHDLPAGGMRLHQRAVGYEATVVAGSVVYRQGEATGALPGRLVRGRP